MGWAVVFVAFLTYLTGIDGQSPWIQPPSRSVSPGGTIAISCTTTQSTKSVSWFQQKPGEVPHYVHCSGCSNRGEGITHRFTATRSGNTGTLTITDAQDGDEADYYCASWDSADTMLHSGEFLWGSVTKTSFLPLQP
uniref:Ig-like domain-containing protein n=1 Tax=Laticauda laticaudata TaxID=8630 RepID=A0A8C5RQ80_LATLA